ncbi:MAG: 2-phosphosulfolactate phosphatase [Trueperaceae bacterium]
MPHATSRPPDDAAVPLRVALLPTELAATPEPALDLVILIDVLRTTTTVPILFDGGLSRVRLSPSLRLARRLAAEDGDLLVGERRGVPPEGFNHGNSPATLQHRDLTGQNATLVSENAPAALPSLAEARELVLASFVNAGAVVRHAADPRWRRIDLVCCGFRGTPDLDDLAVAGLLADRLQRVRTDLVAVGATRMAIDLVRLHADPLPLLLASRAGRYLRDLGLDRDVGVAVDLDRSDAVPRMGPPERREGGTVYPFLPAASDGPA